MVEHGSRLGVVAAPSPSTWCMSPSRCPGMWRTCEAHPAVLGAGDRGDRAQEDSLVDGNRANGRAQHTLFRNSPPKLLAAVVTVMSAGWPACTAGSEVWAHRGVAEEHLAAQNSMGKVLTFPVLLQRRFARA
jgi:hypothetical protein